MRELSDDIITKRIKEVMEQDEPDYSPQFWEKIRKQRPVPESRLITLFQKFKFWFPIVTITGFLSIVYVVTQLLPADKNPAINPLSPKSVDYSVSMKAREITKPEATPASGTKISNNSIGREEENLTSKVIPSRMASLLPVSSQLRNPAENEITRNSVKIEEVPGIDVLPEVTDFSLDFRTKKLVPIEHQAEGNHLLKRQDYDKTNKILFHWPDFNSLFTRKAGYDKFAGPNKLTFFYSPEFHFIDSNTSGVSQGTGISFEGPVRSLVSFSVGLSYQAYNFHNTFYLGKVLPHLELQPTDTIRTYYMADSIGIKSGSYKFLEIPVSLNFRFLETPRSQVWLGTGLSAIAFLRQEYTYEKIVEEESYSSSISVKPWKNIYPLASLNFSLLYRYDFNDRFLLHGSIQYKQHLCEMGYNSMKLNRLNMQIGLIYRFGRGD
jgi:hypothetical protein